MEPTMEIREDATLATDLPRSLAQHGDHVSTIDALEDHIEAVITHLSHCRHRETLGTDVGHHPSLLCHRASLPGAPKYQPRAVLEDVGISAGCQQGTRFHHQIRVVGKPAGPGRSWEAPHRGMRHAFWVRCRQCSSPARAAVIELRY